MAKESRNDKRVARHQRIRKNLYGTPEKPRLCVFRSSKNISVQIIDDVNGVTLASASTVDKELKSQVGYGGNKDAAKSGGTAAVEAAKRTVLTSRLSLSLPAYRATRRTKHVWPATRKALRKPAARSLRCSTATVWLRRLQPQWNPLCRCIRTALMLFFLPTMTWQ